MSENLITIDAKTDPQPITASCNSGESGGANPVAKLRDLLGKDVILLHLPYGCKGPKHDGWQKTQLAAMDDPTYLARLARGNVGVLQGAPSNGLCSIDIDNDVDVEPFLALNPVLRKTLQTCGARGRNLWVRVTGDYEPLTKLQRKDGTAWGEWRSTGGQTVIHGKHPEGCHYRIVNEAKPVEIAFESIIWPEGLTIPWDFGVYHELVAQHGDPYFCTSRSIKLNQYFFVAKFAVEHLVIFEPDERQFYVYDEQHGLWRAKTDEAIKDCFSLDFKAYADSQRRPQILSQRTNAFLGGLTELLKGHVERRGFFERKRRIIHVNNGMLHLDISPPELREFSPDYASRNQCPIDLLEGADCPRFKNELLGSALDTEDISLLKRWLGSLLLGGNVAQRLMLLVGKAGEGKSTLVDAAEKIIGPENVAELRTDLLGERFEQARFIGKVLLTGKDVAADFLMRKGASHMKKLVGHDLLSAERKHGNACLNLRGDFGVVITCNSRLRVQLEGDADAWRRRLMIIEYSRPKPKGRIANFAEKLLHEEGPGILNWIIYGAMEHLRELDTAGDFALSKPQLDRVEVLLAESDSVREFVRLCLVASPRGDVTADELFGAYERFCENMGYRPVARFRVAQETPDLIAEIHGVHKRHDIKRDEGPQRGYKGLELGGSAAI